MTMPLEQAGTALFKLHQSGEIRGGVVRLFKGRELLQGAYIGHSFDNKGLDENTKVRVASISKLSTCIGLLILAQEGKIDLDSDCSPNLGFELKHPNFPESPITPRMILSHTSSIRDGENYKGIIGETLESFFVAGGANYQNGEHWAKDITPLGGFCYSNLGFGIIAQLIENISKLRFDVFIKTKLFDPLGIDCGFNWSGVSESSIENISPLYRRANNSIAWVVQVDKDVKSQKRPIVFAQNNKTLDDYKIGTNGLLFSPQGGLRASAKDLEKITQVLMGYHNILSPKSIENMRQIVWSNSISPVAKGGEDGSFQAFGTGIHHIIADDNAPINGLKTNLLGHYGQAYGLLGGLWFEPISQKGFIWFVNGSLEQPVISKKSGLFELEEIIMNAAAIDLKLAE